MQQLHSYDAFCEQVEQHIAEYGCEVIAFPGPDNRPISYTIGLTDRGWKELVFVGLRPDYAQGIINAIVQNGQEPICGVPITNAANTPLKVGPVCDEAVIEYLCQAVFRQARKGGPKVQALQLIMCDKEGRFPGDPAYDADSMKPQFLLDTPVNALLATVQ